MCEYTALSYTLQKQVSSKESSILMDNIIQKIISEFALFDDWEDKYAYLIELGGKLPKLESIHQIEANRVHGCTSTVWMVEDKHEDQPERFYFRADSDAYIVRGLIALLMRVYSGRLREEVALIDIQYLFNQLGLDKYLSPNRSNGFFAMINRVKEISR